MSDFKVGRVRGVKQVLPVVDKQQNEKKTSKMKQKPADDENKLPEINSKTKHIDELI